MMRLFQPAFCSVIFQSTYIQQRAFDVFPTIDPAYSIFRNSRHLFMVNTLCHEVASLPRPWCFVTRKAFRPHASLAELDAVCVHPSGERRYYAALEPNFMVPE